VSDARLAQAAAERLRLADGWAGWGLWCLRSAGFPAELVLQLASPDLAACADRLLAIEAEIELARLAAIEEGRRLPRDGGDGDGKLKKALRALNRQRLPPADGLPEALVAKLRVVEEATGRATQARAAISAVWRDEGVRLAQAMRGRALDPRLREAVLWQNRGAVSRTVDALLGDEAGPAWRRRQRELWLASYLQRYCVKNDTIGFFGPVGWAHVEPAAPALALVPGPTLLASRDVALEYWAVDALAERLADDPELKPDLAPRRHPTLRVEGTTLHHPIERTSELPDAHARALALADGVRSARSIAAEMLADEALELSDEEEVYGLLEELRERRLILWTLEVPTTGAHPERLIRGVLEALPPSPARARATGALDEIDAARDRVAAAAGDPASLDGAAAGLEELFARVTGKEGTRRGGELYAARTLFYEDCRRDADVSIGPALVDAVRAPIALLLDTARWYTYTIAVRYLERFQAVYRELRAGRGDAAVDYLRFWEQVSPLFPNSPTSNSPIAARVSEELRARWAEILGDLSGRTVERSAAELQPRVAAAFAAPHAGWPSARYHTPDLMIAGPSAEAVARGEFQIVLGEVHVSMHTYSMSPFLQQHPLPSSIVAGREADVPEACVIPVTPRRLATRSDHFWLTGHNFDLEVGDARSFRPRDRVLAVGELVVEESDGRLQVRTRDRRHRFEILAFFEYYLMAESMNHFGLLPPTPHSPRLTVDKLVLEREKWRFTPEALAFAREEDGEERFLTARRWARREGFPRHVFVRTPEEAKPVYIDFDSPTYVDLLAKLARPATGLTVSEMMPAFGQHWLRDGAGAAYASELRIACVDQSGWRPI
jgi:hypothetical protein